MANEPTLKKLYKEQVVPQLMKEFNYSTVMQCPKIEKIVLNQGLGEATQDKKIIEIAKKEMALISGQQPVETLSRKDIAGFKLRKGTPIGVKVTLRGSRMYEFMDRLFNLALPRVRDFKGINPNAFDGRGNYSLGLKEQIIFPEIEYEKVDKIRGMDIAFVTTATNDEEAKALLELMGAPFAK